MNYEQSEPRYVISVVARMLGVHAQTLRYYERLGLVSPSRSQGNIRLYSAEDVDRLRRIKTLMNDLGVNLAGVEVILRMAERMARMDREMQELEIELKRLVRGDSVGSAAEGWRERKVSHDETR